MDTFALRTAKKATHQPPPSTSKDSSSLIGSLSNGATMGPNPVTNVTDETLIPTSVSSALIPQSQQLFSNDLPPGAPQPQIESGQFARPSTSGNEERVWRDAGSEDVSTSTTATTASAPTSTPVERFAPAVLSIGTKQLDVISQLREQDIKTQIWGSTSQNVSSMKPKDLINLTTNLEQAVKELPAYVRTHSLSEPQAAELRAKVKFTIEQAFQRYQTLVARTEILNGAPSSVFLEDLKAKYTLLEVEDLRSTGQILQMFQNMIETIQLQNGTTAEVAQTTTPQWMSRKREEINTAWVDHFIKIFQEKTSPIPYTSGGVYAAPPASETEANRAILTYLETLKNPEAAAIKYHPDNLGRTYLGITSEAVHQPEDQRTDSAHAEQDAKTKAGKEAIAMIAMLKDQSKLQRLKDAHKEHDSVTALDMIAAKDPAKIILAAQPPGEVTVPEKKSWWAPVRLFQWLTRTEPQKDAFREGIKVARVHVFSKYGAYAVERFDNHFALRYRNGSPLTVGALNRFLANEKKLYPIAAEVLPQAASVVSFNLTKEMTANQFSEEISARAVLEFRERYYTRDSPDSSSHPYGLKRPDTMSEDDETILFIDFYQNYLKRPIVIAPAVAEIQGKGFFSARWNALWTSVFPGNNNRANEEIKKQLTDWIVGQMPDISQAAEKTNGTIKAEIESKLKQQPNLTLEDVINLIGQGEQVAADTNTWYNYLFYNWWKPVVGNVAIVTGAAAGAALVANDSDMKAGALKAAALAGALYTVGENRPGLQLSIALSALWAANNPKAIGATENSVFGYLKGAAKYGAIAAAGVHFPPLFLLAAIV